MPFSGLPLDPSLHRALKELGFTRPTPIQLDSIPPGLEGRDLLACAMTGSGKTAAFLLPIIHRLLGRPRGVTRALVLTPTRELAAQIVESLNELAVHTPITGAAVFGGVGMGPQEHAFRTGVDILVATPGRLLDHFRMPYARLDKLEYLVLDEADRMLDMGFLPDIRRVLKHLPVKRQTMLFSATMPTEIAGLARDMLKDPVTINVQRAAAPAVGITQAVYPIGREQKAALLLTLLQRGDMGQALVFTRTKHRADRLCKFLVRHGINAERIHGNRSQAQRTAALAGFKSGAHRVLVATDIAARGIDVEALGHVLNFDVPAVPEDYIHRVGRTGRAEMTGEAFTFVSPDEDADLKNIERAIGKRLPRVTVPDFDAKLVEATPLEIPLAERIAAIRAKKAEDRERAKAKLARKEAMERQRNFDRARGVTPGQNPARTSDRPGERGPGRGPDRRPRGDGARGPGGPPRGGG
ncbi:MAG: DEAD/DEAH box helicase, partial [Gemmatimonadales bacterium]|nr:DEAD/DEAH box helicase [Gemmatimonadales bacterium]